MLTALITFLASAGGRLALGHLFDAIVKWQDHGQELARMRLQAELEAAQHDRNMRALQLQAGLGLRVIEAQTQSRVTGAEADAFTEAVRAAGQRTGLWFIDGWNGAIRPLLATICIGLWAASLLQRHGVLDDWDRALMSAALGVFIGGRIHATGR